MATEQERLDKAKELADFCIRCAEDKIAEDPVLLPMNGKSSIADYFVVATANSDPHLQALANFIERQVREVFHLRPLSGGDDAASGGWVLLDFGDVIVHLMRPEIREKYQLENLWGEIRRPCPRQDGVE